MAARRGARVTGQNGVNCGRMCRTCAFKAGQEKTPDLVDACDGALHVIMGGGQFQCHEPDMSDANGLPCTGFWLAKQYFDSLDKDDNESIEHVTALGESCGD